MKCIFSSRVIREVGKMNKWKGMLILGMAAFLLGACVQEKKGESEKVPVTDVKASADEDYPKPKQGTGKNPLNPMIAELTAGEVEILYTNKKPGFIYDMNDFIVSVDKYQLTKVTGVNQWYEDIFKGKREGYVISALVTIENKRKDPVYYSDMLTIYLEDRESTLVGNKRHFIPLDEELNLEEEGVYPAGFKEQRFQTFVLSQEEYDKMTELRPKFNIAGLAREAEDDYTRKFEAAVFDFVYSDAYKKELASAPVLYQDAIVNKNLGSKTIAYEKTDIGQQLRLGEVQVELEGVQYAKVEPSPAHMDKFYEFDEEDEIFAVTAKFQIDNQSNETLDLSAISSALYDQNETRYRKEGMLESDKIRILGPGESAEKFHVFLLTKAELAQIESLTLTFGPFLGDGERLFKGRDIIFKLPIRLLNKDAETQVF